MRRVETDLGADNEVSEGKDAGSSSARQKAEDADGSSPHSRSASHELKQETVGQHGAREVLRLLKDQPWRSLENASALQPAGSTPLGWPGTGVEEGCVENVDVRKSSNANAQSSRTLQAFFAAERANAAPQTLLKHHQNLGDVGEDGNAAAPG